MLPPRTAPAPTNAFRQAVGVARRERGPGGMEPCWGAPVEEVNKGSLQPCAAPSAAVALPRSSRPMPGTVADPARDPSRRDLPGEGSRRCAGSCGGPSDPSLDPVVLPLAHRHGPGGMLPSPDNPGRSCRTLGSARLAPESLDSRASEPVVDVGRSGRCASLRSCIQGSLAPPLVPS